MIMYSRRRRFRRYAVRLPSWACCGMSACCSYSSARRRTTCVSSFALKRSYIGGAFSRRTSSRSFESELTMRAKVRSSRAFIVCLRELTVRTERAPVPACAWGVPRLSLVVVRETSGVGSNVHHAGAKGKSVPSVAREVVGVTQCVGGRLLRVGDPHSTGAPMLPLGAREANSTCALASVACASVPESVVGDAHVVRPRGQRVSRRTLAVAVGLR